MTSQKPTLRKRAYLVTRLVKTEAYRLVMATSIKDAIARDESGEAQDSWAEDVYVGPPRVRRSPEDDPDDA